MLRLAYMPSDFHPCVLALGDRDDCLRLAAILRTYALADADVVLHEAVGVSAHETSIVLTRNGDVEGCWAVGPSPADLRWTLSSERAKAFADAVADLADPRSGQAQLFLNATSSTRSRSKSRAASLTMHSWQADCDPAMLRYAFTVNWPIMPASSCSRMWQWYM